MLTLCPTSTSMTAAAFGGGILRCLACSLPGSWFQFLGVGERRFWLGLGESLSALESGRSEWCTEVRSGRGHLAAKSMIAADRNEMHFVREFCVYPKEEEVSTHTHTHTHFHIQTHPEKKIVLCVWGCFWAALRATKFNLILDVLRVKLGKAS